MHKNVGQTNNYNCYLQQRCVGKRKRVIDIYYVKVIKDWKICDENIFLRNLLTEKINNHKNYTTLSNFKFQKVKYCEE